MIKLLLGYWLPNHYSNALFHPVYIYIYIIWTQHLVFACPPLMLPKKKYSNCKETSHTHKHMKWISLRDFTINHITSPKHFSINAWHPVANVVQYVGPKCKSFRFWFDINTVGCFHKHCFQFHNHLWHSTPFGYYFRRPAALDDIVSRYLLLNLSSVLKRKCELQ